MANVYDIIIRPVITERSMADVANKKYVFEVAKTAGLLPRSGASVQHRQQRSNQQRRRNFSVPLFHHDPPIFSGVCFHSRSSCCGSADAILFKHFKSAGLKESFMPVRMDFTASSCGIAFL